MKTLIVSMIGLFISISLFAQVPNAFKYQAVARDGDGKVIANQEVSLTISILQGSLGGTEVFTETHDSTTNAYGLVTLNIGAGNPTDFANIDWSDGPYFVKVEMDGSLMGTSQLLSVPFAKYADIAGNVEQQVLSISNDTIYLSDGGFVKLPPSHTGTNTDEQQLSISNDTIYLENGGFVMIPEGFSGDYNDLVNKPNLSDSVLAIIDGTETKINSGTNVSVTGNGSSGNPYVINASTAGGSSLPQYTQDEIDALTPDAGMLVYNTDYKMLQFYDGTQWNGSQSSGCVPQPDAPYAGSNQFDLLVTNTTLSANQAGEGINGSWSIVKGEGGSFVDSTKHNTTFNMILDQEYQLRWTLWSACDTLHDDMLIRTYRCPGDAIAGSDVTTTNFTINISGNEPGEGINGYWSVASKNGGTFGNINNHETTFTGSNDSLYQLAWNLYSVCDTNTSYKRVYMSNTVKSIDFNGTMYICPVDNSTHIKWDENGTEITDGNGADSDTDGEANTSAIVSQLGSDGHAAYMCDTLTAYGYSDWYLPSKNELNAMYQNKATIGGFISSSYYWSSTEYDDFGAWCQSFTSGNQSYAIKDRYYRVRCVRRD